MRVLSLRTMWYTIVFINKNNQQKRTSTTHSTHRGSSSIRTQAYPNFTPNQNFSPKTKLYWYRFGPTCITKPRKAICISSKSIKRWISYNNINTRKCGNEKYAPLKINDIIERKKCLSIDCNFLHPIMQERKQKSSWNRMETYLARWI